MTLTILHTNDLHNRLDAARLADIAGRRRQLLPNVLLLDAGDAVGSGNITFRPGGEPILAGMSDAGYDAMVVGNREFHFSRIGFATKLSLARFPVLSANIRPRDADGSPPPVRDHLVVERAGLRILLVGLTVPMITERMAVRQFSPYIFDPPVAIGVARIRELRADVRPDLAIALTHIGLANDRRLAAETEGLDLIIGGHSHDVLPEGERVGGTLIVQTGSHGRNIGRVGVTHSADGALILNASLEVL